MSDESTNSASAKAWRVTGLVFAIYFASTWLQAPIDSKHLVGNPHFQVGPVALSPPMVLSGDSPHYLVAINSLVEDADFDVGNNHDQALAGDIDMGRRYRGRPIDRHADLDATGRWIPTHSPAFVTALASLTFPMRSSAWMEPICIWLAMASGAFAVFWLAKKTSSLVWPWALAFATPYWSYSRDIWTETGIASIWVGLTVLRHPAALFAAGFAGTLLKYPFALVPATMGVLAFRRGERVRGLALTASALFGLAAAILWVQFLFRRVDDHFSLFHSGIHGGFDFPFDGAWGLLMDPANGILFFCPFLVWALRPLCKRPDLLWPMAVFFLVHASYSDWMGGTGFSARYLVPMLPLLVYLVAQARPHSLLFRASVAYSLVWSLIGGLAPAIVYDRTPWGAAAHVLRKLTAD